MMCERVGEVGVEGLAVVDALCAGDVVVHQEVAGLHLLLLIACNHVQPGFNHLVLLGHIVVEVVFSLVLRQHHEVVDAVLSLVDGRVVLMTRYLLVCHSERRVSRQAQRQIDRATRSVSNRLGLVLRAQEHQVNNLLRLVRDNLCQQLLLRIDKLRLYLRTVAKGHVANQVDGVARHFLVLVNR